MKEENKDIFNIKYSTSSVFEETIAKIKNMGRSYGKESIQLDIDDKRDFLNLYKILKKDEGISCNNTRQLVNQIMEKCDKDE